MALAKLFDTSTSSSRVDVGLLVLRLALGVLMLTHGWGKLTGFGELSTKFPDPIGLGSGVALALAVFAEVFCSLFIILGFATRLSTIPLIITMLVAVFVIHGADPFAKKELGLMYMFPYITLLLAGAGKYSLDSMIHARLTAGK